MSRMLEALQRLEAGPVTDREISADRPAREPPADAEPSAPSALPFAKGKRTAESTAPHPDPLPEGEATASPMRLPVAAEGPLLKLADTILAQFPPPQSSVLVFSSACEGEGKTTTLSSLAVALCGRVSGEIVIVDADFHRPSVAPRFGLRADPCLTDVLAGWATWREATCPTFVDRLSVLPGRAAEKFDRDPEIPWNVKTLFAEMRRHFAMVLVDTASLAHRELVPLASACDGVCLVVRLGRTPRRAVDRAIGEVRHRGGNVFGCVLTGAERY